MKNTSSQYECRVHVLILYASHIICQIYVEKIIFVYSYIKIWSFLSLEYVLNFLMTHPVFGGVSRFSTSENAFFSNSLNTSPSVGSISSITQLQHVVKKIWPDSKNDPSPLSIISVVEMKVVARSPPQRTWCKFSRQMKHFCCGSTFILHDNGVLVPLKLQMFETGLYSGIFWNRNLLSSCVNWQTVKRVKAVTTLMLMLMLMLAQVNALRSSNYQTPIKPSTVHPEQVQHDDSLWRQIRVFVE